MIILAYYQYIPVEGKISSILQCLVFYRFKALNVSLI